MGKSHNILSLCANKLRRYPFSCLCIATIWVLCLIPIPETPLSDVNMIDKWTHLVMYGGLCTVIWMEYTWRHRTGNQTARKKPLFLGAFISPLVMGGLVEVAQATCTGGTRNGDIADWVADAIGVVLGQITGMLLARVLSNCRRGH